MFRDCFWVFGIHTNQNWLTGSAVSHSVHNINLFQFSLSYKYNKEQPTLAVEKKRELQGATYTMDSSSNYNIPISCGTQWQSLYVRNTQVVS